MIRRPFFSFVFGRYVERSTMDRSPKGFIWFATFPIFTAMGCGVYYADEAQVEDPSSYASSEAPPSATDEASSIASPQEEYEDSDPRALTDFRSELEPYGSWVDDTTYGTIWTPHAEVVGLDFSPYVTAGRWVYNTDYTWVSDYSWGWVPFHYGRWLWISSRGWSWVPGRRYRGAWVEWRTGPSGYGYVGWAPLAPQFYWRGGSTFYPGWRSRTPYVFCPSGSLFDHRVGQYIVRGSQAATIGAATRRYDPYGGRIPGHPGVSSLPRSGANPQVYLDSSRSGSYGQRGSPAFSRGPAPHELGVDLSRVSRSAATEPGVARALSFSRPSPSYPSQARSHMSRSPAIGSVPDSRSGYSGGGDSSRSQGGQGGYRMPHVTVPQGSGGGRSFSPSPSPNMPRIPAGGTVRRR